MTRRATGLHVLIAAALVVGAGLILAGCVDMLLSGPGIFDRPMQP